MVRSRGIPALLLLAAVVLLAGPAAAAAQTATGTLTVVVVDESGGPVSGAELSNILNGQKQSRGATGSNGTESFDVSVLNLGKNTPVRVVVIKCGEKIEVQFVPPNEKERCEDEEDPQKKCECREGGIILWGSGRLVVRMTKTGATVSFTPDEPGGSGGGPRVDLTLLGAWKRTTFPNVDGAIGTIDGRYRAANYNEFATEVKQSDNGFGVGAALRVMFGAVGVMGGYSYQDLGQAEVHTAGTRVLNNLAFQLDSTFQVKAHKVIVGVPIGWSRFVVTPYFGRAFWDRDRTIVDSLRSGTVQVSGSTRSDSADGSDNMFGGRAEAYVHDLFALFIELERINFKNMFETGGADALPADPDNTNILVGIAIRLPLRR